MDLKWSYSSSKGNYIGYKVTMVLEKNSLTSVLILIHKGAPYDTKIYKEVLENLKQSRIIRPLDILLFDKGYFSYENYKIGIIEYRIIHKRHIFTCIIDKPSNKHNRKDKDGITTVKSTMI